MSEQRKVHTFDPHNPDRRDGTHAFTPAEYRWGMVKLVMQYAAGAATFAAIIEAIYLGTSFTLLGD